MLNFKGFLLNFLWCVCKPKKLSYIYIRNFQNQIAMSPPISLQEFEKTKQKIDKLNNNHPRFKQIYNEYQLFKNQLWNLQTSEVIEQIPDDFVDAIKIQISYLEDEINDWLKN